MDHRKHTPLSRSEINEAVISRAPVYDTENRRIGVISQVHGADRVTEVVIEVGGFLGFGARPVQLGVEELTLMRDENGKVRGVTSWTKDQLSALPDQRQ